MQVKKTIHTGLLVLGDIFGNNGTFEGTLYSVGDATFASKLFLPAIPSAVTAQSLYYNPTTKEVSYGAESIGLWSSDANGIYTMENVGIGMVPDATYGLSVLGKVQIGVDTEVHNFRGNLTLDSPSAGTVLTVNEIARFNGETLMTNDNPLQIYNSSAVSTWVDDPTSSPIPSIQTRNSISSGTNNYTALILTAQGDGLGESDRAYAILSCEADTSAAPTRSNFSLTLRENSVQYATVFKADYSSHFTWRARNAYSISHILMSEGDAKFTFGFYYGTKHFQIDIGSQLSSKPEFCVTDEGKVSVHNPDPRGWLNATIRNFSLLFSDYNTGSGIEETFSITTEYASDTLSAFCGMSISIDENTYTPRIEMIIEGTSNVNPASKFIFRMRDGDNFYNIPLILNSAGTVTIPIGAGGGNRYVYIDNDGTLQAGADYP